MLEQYADANYWFALFVPKDQLHRQAREAAANVPAGCRVVTSALVIIEVLNGLSRELPEVKRRAVLFFESLHLRPEFVVIPFSTTLYERALALYLQSTDKDWGLVDCYSFIIMRDRKIHSALTHDRHFEQAGFRALLRET